MNIIEDKRKKITVRGLSGLQNIGNTCYMNAVIQCFMATDIFSIYLKGGKFKNDLIIGTINKIINDIRCEMRKETEDINEITIELKKNKIKEGYYNSITYNLYKVIQGLWKYNSIVIPYNLKEIIGNKCETFGNNDQCDSEELLTYILDQIHEETKTDIEIDFIDIPESVYNYQHKKQKYNILLENDNISDLEKINIVEEYKEYKKGKNIEDIIYKSLQFWNKYLKNNHSRIIDIFTGVYFTDIKCNECDVKSHSFEPFNVFHLPIPDNINITLNECIDNYTKMEELTNENENQYYCKSCNKLTNAKQIINFWNTPERFIIHFKRFKNNLTKNNNFIDFPLNDLSLSNNISSYVKNDISYDLYGVIRHLGNFNGGHYIAYTKNIINNLWYEFNDTNVVCIDPENVQSEIVNSGAYILFYKKRE